jgi:anti-sigma regulatory factor (Ser/Thr protein kinase)
VDSHSRAPDEGPPGGFRPEYRTELPADVERIPDLLEELVRRGRAAGFPARRLRFNFRVGVCEALANAMRHGASEEDASVRVEAAFSAARIEVTVTDPGGGFDPSRVPDPTTPENLTLSTGRGVFLIRKLMDRVEYNAVGNSLRMVLYARGGPAGEAK